MATSTAYQPTTRSRTNLFISYRDSQARASRYARSRRHYVDVDDDHDAGEAQRLIIDDNPGTAALHIDIAPPVDLLVLALDKLHAKHVLPGFKDRSAEEREIEQRTNEITREFRRCHSLIQRISASSHTFPPNSSSQNDATSARNVQRALAAKVQDLSALFRTKQRIYMQKLQGHAISRNDQMVAGVKELDIATRYQRNTGRRKCIFLLLLIIFGLILVLIFKPRKHSRSVDTPQAAPTRMLYYD
ncbi:hypothetical protein RSAG8_04423, partial [Rhizoctonia solani AG-8 WAC10335]